MEDAPNWPAVVDRYDPYDPRHPRWADRFWGEYCARPGAPPPPDQDPPRWTAAAP